jgi:hypothetical protein
MPVLTHEIVAHISERGLSAGITTVIVIGILLVLGVTFLMTQFFLAWACGLSITGREIGVPY